jgi:hypothetical protein
MDLVFLGAIAVAFAALAGLVRTCDKLGVRS